MPRKKKKGKGELPSGKIRLQVYDRSDPILDESGKPVLDPETGKPKLKRIYKSITADSLAEAEILKAAFIQEKKTGKRTQDLTVGQAIDKYIHVSEPTLSPTTIERYKSMREKAFQDLMDVKLQRVTPAMLKQSVALEAKRPKAKKGKEAISAKTLRNEYGLLTAALNLYAPQLDLSMTLPQVVSSQHEILPPDEIFRLVQGTEIELPVLLAMWLSFTISEIKGLTKSKSISPDGRYITIVETSVVVDNQAVVKSTAKQPQRRRMLQIPDYLRKLIDKVETDELVTLPHHVVTQRWMRMVSAAGLPHMTFHDLRHVNASVMAFLGEDQVPAQYARARGGWASDHVMRRNYMQIYDRKRQEVDQNIDRYFETELNLNQERRDEKEILGALQKLPEEKFQDLIRAGTGPEYQRFLRFLESALPKT